MRGYLSKRVFQNDSCKIFFSNLLGNISGHYDTALYGLLAPIIASVFFPQLDQVTALLLTYSFLAISLLGAPIGIYIFGNLAIKYGAKRTLSIALCGVGITTTLTGLIPEYETLGIYAPLLLIFARLTLEIFATGENVVANTYMIEQTRASYRGRVEGLFQGSSIVGIIIASTVSMMVYNSDHPELYWRLSFIAGAIVALPGIYIRLQSVTDKVSCTGSPFKIPEIFKLLRQNKSKIIQIIAASGFSYLPYVIPFVFFNNFVPRITNISQSDMVFLNTILLYIDMLLFPLIGYYADKFTPIKMMLCATMFIIITAIPAFILLDGANIITVTCIKLILIIPGIAFVIPMYTWMNSLFDKDKKYLLIGIGYGVGSTIFGRSAPAICLWLWSITSSPIAPALYITFIGIAAILALTYCKD